MRRSGYCRRSHFPRRASLPGPVEILQRRAIAGRDMGSATFTLSFGAVRAVNSKVLLWLSSV
jgi:hypothetical protein